MMCNFSLILFEYVLCSMYVGNRCWSIYNCLVSPYAVWSELSYIQGKNAQSKVFFGRITERSAISV